MLWQPGWFLVWTGRLASAAQQPQIVCSPSYYYCIVWTICPMSYWLIFSHNNSHRISNALLILFSLDRSQTLVFALTASLYCLTSNPSTQVTSTPNLDKWFPNIYFTPLYTILGATWNNHDRQPAIKTSSIVKINIQIWLFILLYSEHWGRVSLSQPNPLYPNISFSRGVNFGDNYPPHDRLSVAQPSGQWRLPPFQRRKAAFLPRPPMSWGPPQQHHKWGCSSGNRSMLAVPTQETYLVNIFAIDHNNVLTIYHPQSMAAACTIANLRFPVTNLYTNMFENWTLEANKKYVVMLNLHLISISHLVIATTKN